MGKDVRTVSDPSGRPSATADTVGDVSQLPDNLIPIVEVGLDFSRVTEITVSVEWYHPPRVPNPTEDEKRECPASFRCYACLERKGKKRHFGGLVLDKRICRGCYPFVDEWDVGMMIKFDERHGFPVD